MRIIRAVLHEEVRTSDIELVTRSPEETQRIGADIGERAEIGDLILLVGNLGAGKTCFTQGVARGLGLADYTSSPSFVLVKEYQGRLNLYHIDFYRLDDIREIAELGMSDYLNRDGICVVEWADRALDLLPEEHLLIKFEHLAVNERRLRFEPRGQRYIRLVKELKERWNSR
ncbi:tRNA (adenosine(37)-N6)-threonylcarbamoyltransferase complex ATPase subunit type 1 TsaE [Dehalococcoidia bacterium]|nr:tRNA (adenosine(37)-N6)-threonylcarbamoyltransferase complex ATPase subunit type 1 TsaE [Dehalococcoidia bacterium]